MNAHSFATTVALLSVLASAEASGQARPVADSSTNSPQHRIAAAGRVWNAVRYFHPSMAWRALDWDSVFVASYPRIRSATTREQYAEAVQRMLDALDDPATRVVQRSSERVVQNFPFISRLADSGVVIRFSAMQSLWDYPARFVQLDSASRAAASASLVILDMRGTRPADNPLRELSLASYLHEGGAAPSLNSVLTAARISVPAQRIRLVSGLVSRTDGSSPRVDAIYNMIDGGYYSAWHIADPTTIVPATPGRAPRVAAIVDDSSVVPDVLVALRANGGATVIAEGAMPPIGAMHFVDIGFGLRARIRISEAVEGDRELWPDTTIAPSSDDAAIRTATRLASTRTAAQQARSSRIAAPTAVPRSDPAFRGTYPDSASRALAAIRFWGAINYFFPHIALTEVDWTAQLPNFITGLEAATDSTSYATAVVAMVRNIHDSHGVVFSNLLNRQRGPWMVPVRIQVIGGRPFVAALLDTAASNAGLRLGDEIISVDGESASTRLRRVDLIGSAVSNEGDGWLIGAWTLMRGAQRTVATVVVSSVDGTRREIRVPRLGNRAALYARENKRAAIDILPGNIGYVDIGRLQVSQVDSMFTMLAKTKGIVFDLREYPNGTATAIAAGLNQGGEKVAQRQRRTVWVGPDTLQRVTQEVPFVIPAGPTRYRGPTVALINSGTGSQGETTALFLRAANGTRLIGSQTSGANGEITTIALPGEIRVNFTGHDVRLPDGGPTQRIGVKPDVVVSPTRAGLAAGRDELLEAALRILSR